jgi:hypothetical protein
MSEKHNPIRVPIKIYAKQRHRCVKTVQRWAEAGILAPDSVVRINGRLYVDETAEPLTDGERTSEGA